jgi:hypothetical protein
MEPFLFISILYDTYLHIFYISFIGGNYERRHQEGMLLSNCCSLRYR